MRKLTIIKGKGTKKETRTLSNIDAYYSKTLNRFVTILPKEIYATCFGCSNTDYAAAQVLRDAGGLIEDDVMLCSLCRYD